MKSRLEKRKEKTLSKLGYATKFVIAVTNLVKALTELLKAILWFFHKDKRISFRLLPW